MVEVVVKTSAEQIISKFAGEEFDVGNIRTVFAGASKDNIKRGDRVILLIGTSGSNKSKLIDCMCNYFYGAKFDGNRYKIADEIFDQSSTPIKSITKYVFNETTMPFRPVIIDTPEVTSDREIAKKEGSACTLHDFLSESQQIQIHALCLVLKFDDESIGNDEKIISETINLFPSYLLPSTIILFSSNEKKKPSLSPTMKLLLRDLNLAFNRYYFFDVYFLQNQENKQDDETAIQQARSSWDLSMSELDRFFEQVKCLSPRQITPDENTDLFGNKMMHDKPTFTQTSTGSIPNERIIPIKLIDPETTTTKTSKALKDWNSSETPLIKRYIYDPGTMTHKEYITRLQKDGRSSPGEYVTMMIPTRKAYETLINDIPPENRARMKLQLSSDENGVAYVHTSTPPPEYSAEMARIKKRSPTLLNMESQQHAHSQHLKSPVQRQIAKRISSESSEYSRSSGISSQQQQQKRPIRQTEQVIQRLEDGVLSPRNVFQSKPSQPPNYQECKNYLKTPGIKRSKSPIRLWMCKKKQFASTSSADVREHFEQPRGIETIDGFQSPLRNYGQLIHDDEQSQDRITHLSEESPTTASTSRPKFRTDKIDAGMKSGYDLNERDELMNLKKVNLEEGLTPHPYRNDSWITDGKRQNFGTDGNRLMEIEKTTLSTWNWNWINCCFFLLAPLFIFFIIIAIIITLALLA